MGEILLPDGTRIGEEAFRGPSPDTQFLAQGLQQIINLLNGVQVQLDTMIRLECNETSRAEVKGRIRRADEIAEERQKQAQQEQAAEAKKVADAMQDEIDKVQDAQAEAEGDPVEEPSLQAVPDLADDEELGGEG